MSIKDVPLWAGKASVRTTPGFRQFSKTWPLTASYLRRKQHQGKNDRQKTHGMKKYVKNVDYCNIVYDPFEILLT